MAPSGKSAAETDSIDRLEVTVDRLASEVQGLSSAMDAVHEELQWVTRNGIPEHTPALGHSVLKRMAVDPTAEDWAERLVVENYGPNQAEQDAADQQALSIKMRRLLATLLASPELTAEELDENTATVVEQAQRVLNLTIEWDGELVSAYSEEESNDEPSIEDGRLF